MINCFGSGVWSLGSNPVFVAFLLSELRKIILFHWPLILNCKTEMIIAKYREQCMICHSSKKSMEPEIDSCLKLYSPEADPNIINWV